MKCRPKSRKLRRSDFDPGNNICKALKIIQTMLAIAVRILFKYTKRIFIQRYLNVDIFVHVQQIGLVGKS